MPNLFIDVEARFAQFADALEGLQRKAEKSFGGIQSSITNLNRGFANLAGGLSIAGLVALSKAAVDSVAHLDDLSEKTSLTVETLSKLQEVTRIGGHSLDDIAGAASKFAKSVSAASGGNEELIRIFKQIGISADDLKSKSFDELFIQFARSIAGATDKTNALAISMKLSGKSASELLPFFNDLSERGLGVAKVTTEQAAAAEKLQKNLAELSKRSAETRDAFVTRLLPGLIQVTEEFKKAVQQGDNLLIVWAKTANATFFGNEQLKRNKETVALLDERLGLEKQLAAVLRPKPFQSQERRDELAQGVRARIAEIDARMNHLKALRDSDDAADRLRATKPEGRELGPVVDQAALEKAKREAEAAAKALDDLVTARAKIAVDAEQNAAKTRLSVLDHFYKEGFAEEQHYWQVRAEIQRAAYEVERKAISDNITVREAAVARAISEHGKSSKEYHEATKGLIEAQASRNKLDADFNAQGTQDVLARSKATQDYENAIKGVNAQLEELKGNSAEAARIRGELQQERLLNDARNRGDLEGEIAVVNLQKATEAQARFNELRERAEQVTARLALEEERIQNSLRVGAIGEFEALRRTETARRNALQTLGLTKAQLDELANTTGFEKLRLEAERFGVQLETLASQSNLVQDKARELFEGAVVDSWREFREEMQRSGKVLDSLGKAFTRFANNVIREIEAIQAKNLAKALFGDGSSGAGGAIAALLKLVGLGGGGSDGGSSVQVAYDPIDSGPSFGDLVGGFSGYAVGTHRVPRTGLALVHQGEEIIPANQAGGDPVLVQNNYIDSRSDRADVERSIERATQRAVAAVPGLVRRGGAYKRAVRG